MQPKVDPTTGPKVEPAVSPKAQGAVKDKTAAGGKGEKRAKKPARSSESLDPCSHIDAYDESTLMKCARATARRGPASPN